MALKEYNLEEVARHSSKDDLFLIIRGQVYDVTDFLDKHPGGPDVLLDIQGPEATQLFDDVGHSLEAHDILKEILVGKLKNQVTIHIGIFPDKW
ncbi:cytochrome b5-like heme/steroid binding domain-containing protein [Lipomyces orientalis]|uniref:Cytochrome b5-like heme/steroid binding domain-containing protein n=1 Tax=Lipomyces orientalis TaxID=1233043 RepID=A0ACC3TF61_9ASCO